MGKGEIFIVDRHTKERVNRLFRNYIDETSIHPDVHSDPAVPYAIAHLVNPDTGATEVTIENLAHDTSCLIDPHLDPVKKVAYYGTDERAESQPTMAQCRQCQGTGGSEAGLCRPCKGAGLVKKAVQDQVDRNYRRALTGTWAYGLDSI